MKTAVVTGATSFLGKELVKCLLDKNYIVYGVVRDNSDKTVGAEGRKNFFKASCSMERISDLPKIVKNADVFFHLAWNGTRGQTRNDGVLQTVNFEQSMRTIDVCYELGCKCFVGAGSQAEYGVKDILTTEETLATPNTEYGKNKLKFTVEGGKKAKELGINFIIPRFFSVYGKDDYENTIVQSNVVKMLKNEDCVLTECIQKWNFIYLVDAVAAMVYLYENGFSGVYNFASDDTRELKSFVEEMKTLTESTSELLYGEIPYPTTGMVSINPSIDKLLSTGFSFEYTFEKGIREIIEFERNRIER